MYGGHSWVTMELTTKLLPIITLVTNEVNFFVTVLSKERHLLLKRDNQLFKCTFKFEMAIAYSK